MPATKREKQLETLVVINIMLLIAFILFKNRFILAGSILFSLICLLSSFVLRVTVRVWNSVFSFLGEINSKILLFIVFFLILTPIASLKKVFSRKSVSVSDNFKSREHIFAAGDLEKMG
jgi:hypothetical protein